MAVTPTANAATSFNTCSCLGDCRHRSSCIPSSRHIQQVYNGKQGEYALRSSNSMHWNQTCLPRFELLQRIGAAWFGRKKVCPLLHAISFLISLSAMSAFNWPPDGIIDTGLEFSLSFLLLLATIRAGPYLITSDHCIGEKILSRAQRPVNIQVSFEVWYLDAHQNLLGTFCLQIFV